MSRAERFMLLVLLSSGITALICGCIGTPESIIVGICCFAPITVSFAGLCYLARRR